jgi:hypothetical protein
MEVIVSRRILGILASIAGSAIGAWWLTSRRASNRAVRRLPTRRHGTVIYDNHPIAGDFDEGAI